MSRLPNPNETAYPFTLADITGTTKIFERESDDSPTLLFFFKHDCATCELTAPLVQHIHNELSGNGLRVIGISQDTAEDTATFISAYGLTFTITLDAELDCSAEYGFDAVPALVLANSNHMVLASFEAFSKNDLTNLVALAAIECNRVAPPLDSLLATLPEERPGCGSRIHDPDIARRLAVKQGLSRLGSRRVRVPDDLDPFEFLDNEGLTDGLPVVAPTEDRVLCMLEHTSRSATDVVALVPPNLAPATVEKVAINAVMAGCKPSYLPVVLAAVEASCTDAFNLHGVLAPTYFVGPLIIVNVPIRHEI